jgi:serine protease Do
MNSKKHLFISLITLMGLFFSINTYAIPESRNTLAPMLEKASPSVVNVKSQIKISDLETIIKLQKQKRASGQTGPIPDKVTSIGSGVIVDAQHGYILTNSHVVDEAQSVVVTLDDGRHYNAKIIGLDKTSDIALLQVRAKNLIAIPVGNSDDLRVGDTVAAIGNPFGLNQTVTSGIVSALGRTALGIESYENFIQTDASINSGNSGGALINTQGQLIGINTAILAPSQGNVGIGFAIPSNISITVMKQLIQYGNVKRGSLGISAQDISPELAIAFNLAAQKGAVVTLVMPNSPASASGFLPGDIITTINGTPIKKANDVVSSIAFLRVDSKATINILRNNKPMTMNVVISDPKIRKERSEKMDPFLHGVGMKDLNVHSPLHGQIDGVIVLSVDEDSNAWHADLIPGDVIVSANQQKVSNIEGLKKIASAAKKTLIINVLRGNGAIYLVINVEES